jgi:DNA-binding beta-propeller fold protein YncE
MAVDRDGNIMVMDTGNKRVQKFDKDGKFLAQFGTVGTDEGRFNEPTGLALDPSGNIYVADTWNRRIQKFDPTFKVLAQWPVSGWESESVLNKPNLAADADGVYATDPEMHRVLRFSTTGAVVAVFGQFGSDTASFNMPVGLALDGAANLYVADAFNNRIVKFAPVK